MDITQLLPILALGLSGYSTIQAHYVSRGEADRDKRLGVLEKQMDLFWSIVEKHMTTVLHSPHTPDLDRLLEKYQSGDTLSEEEVNDLSHRLLTVINDQAEPRGTRAVAVFLLAAMSLRYDLDVPIERGSEANNYDNTV